MDRVSQEDLDTALVHLKSNEFFKVFVDGLRDLHDLAVEDVCSPDAARKHGVLAHRAGYLEALNKVLFKIDSASL